MALEVLSSKGNKKCRINLIFIMKLENLVKEERCFPSMNGDILVISSKYMSLIRKVEYWIKILSNSSGKAKEIIEKIFYQ